VTNLSRFADDRKCTSKELVKAMRISSTEAFCASTLPVFGSQRICISENADRGAIC
jgi:hypothetical protein